MNIQDFSANGMLASQFLRLFWVCGKNGYSCLQNYENSNKGNNKIIELRTILQRESKNS
jgi:hypothetical protein